MTQVLDLSKPAASTRLRWGFALLVMEPALLFGVFVSGSAVLDGNTATSVGIVIVSVILRIAAVVAFVGGIVLLWLGSSRSATGSGLTRVAVGLGGAGVLLFTPALVLFFGATSFAPLALGAILAATAGGVLVVIAVPVGAVAYASWRLRGSRTIPQRVETVEARARRRDGVAGAAAVVSLVVVGLLVSLVWTPSAAAGLPVPSIFDRLGSDAVWSVAAVVIWAVFWIVAAIALLGATAAPRPRPLLERLATTQRVVTATLWVAGSAVCLQWFAYFALGRSISDDIPGVPGGTSVVGICYSLVGVVLLCAAVIRTFAPGGRVIPGGSWRARRAVYPAAPR